MSSNPIHSLDSLQQADHQLSPPFQVELSDGRWACQSLLRILPQRRVVLLLERDGQHQVVKIFYRAKDYQREVQGHQHLQSAGIATPERIEHSKDHGQPAQLVRYQYLQGDSLQAHWQQAGEAEQQQALEQAVTLCARMHRAGLRQQDIHLDNFIRDNHQIFVIDCGSIDAHSAPLNANLARDNLAILMAQLPPRYDRHLDTVWQCYQHHLKSTPFTAEALRQAVNKKRHYRWRHFARKLARDCTEFVTQRDPRSFQVMRREQDDDTLRAILADPDHFIAEGQSLKQGNTASVSAIELNQRTLVLKRYNLKNRRHAIGRSWRPSRAWSAWENAYRLRFNGIRTPLPIAVKEERLGPIRRRAFLITEQVNGCSLAEAFADSEASPWSQEQLLQQVIELFESLYQAGLSHGDTKASNLMVDANGITLIDLDSMLFHTNQRSLKKALHADLRRFLRNWQGELRQTFDEALAHFTERLKD
ncbi:phosphotransferase [Aestuariirhabdus sp. Z084]|uniref:lipopolysaccharide kinase InaA family protein n=1 Tax=Aestuariirhabdus haliotis TaxID=2918751 RepID=UPI00201B3DA1|nr:lipopolysaccharide kinase InaA family protein [Aestuariirhabdus haliotis]MCL6417627.1 phosphotransferase [Aestuariirhabdus haliotis]MCL6421553.1 phosphotransferase [Aestuariirhabdus haliotis]